MLPKSKGSTSSRSIHSADRLSPFAGVTSQVMASPNNTTQQSTPDLLVTPTMPQLKETADRIQTRFHVTGPTALFTLKRWRAALHARYRNSETRTVIWRDVDHFNQDIECSDRYLDCSTPDVPTDLGRTFVQVFGGKTKKITITVIFRKRRISGGTCHIQGHEVDQWVLDEFRSLCAYVQQLQDNCADPNDNHPV
ncbi:hypothetical protein BaRGS_00028163 [Batillaria attramentaria]|uniref:Uncharacterized protein n=1 Tax=Batillaria attramentaria TaxID=370345 RepID=A0ABD0K152_9CAEN